jgi:hypothetical protein
MRSFIRSVGARPTQALEYPLWLVQLMGGIVVLLPNFVPTQAPSGNLAAVGSLLALKIYGIILLSIGIAGLVGRIWEKRSWSVPLRRNAAFASFFIFFYFTLLRMIIMGVENLGWATFFLNACMAAVIYLHLKWDEKT